MTWRPSRRACAAGADLHRVCPGGIRCRHRRHPPGVRLVLEPRHRPVGRAAAGRDCPVRDPAADVLRQGSRRGPPQRPRRAQRHRAPSRRAALALLDVSGGKAECTSHPGVASEGMGPLATVDFLWGDEDGLDLHLLRGSSSANLLDGLFVSDGSPNFIPAAGPGLPADFLGVSFACDVLPAMLVQQGITIDAKGRINLTASSPPAPILRNFLVHARATHTNPALPSPLEVDIRVYVYESVKQIWLTPGCADGPSRRRQAEVHGAGRVRGLRGGRHYRLDQPLLVEYRIGGSPVSDGRLGYRDVQLRPDLRNWAAMAMARMPRVRRIRVSGRRDCIRAPR